MNQKNLLIVVVVGVVLLTCTYFVKDFVFSLNLDLETLFYTLLNGAFLIIGVYLGEKMTMNGLENRLRKWTAESSRIQQLFGILDKVSKMLDDPETERDLNKLLGSASEFFESGKELVTSPEAKNFFKNATELVKQFSTKEQSGLTLPDKPGSTPGSNPEKEN